MNSSVIKQASEGQFDNEVAYGWSSNAKAWEDVFAMAKKSHIHANAVLQMIPLMEERGIADLPRAGQFMRTAARIAHDTTRERDMTLAIRNSRFKR